MAFDAESRLVVSVVPGERTAENVAAVVRISSVAPGAG